MAAGTCTADQFTSKTGECCDRCDAGSYVRAECDGTKATDCAECEQAHFLATPNYMKKCQPCRVCNSDSRLEVLKVCTAREDTLCTCRSGFYCSNDKCEHCQPVHYCPLGEGVKTPASHTSDTVCGKCEEGTFSNVTDFLSPCRPHTRCEDFGRVLSSPGTPTRDAVCGDFKSRCHWMLPAGLWSGLVLSIFILLVLCWWLKRRSQRSELKDYSPETCAVEGCDLPAYKPDDDMVPCSTPLKVSLTGFSNGNGSTGYCTNNFSRSFSEPQEDEWCET